jgi:type II secretory pathway component PulF
MPLIVRPGQFTERAEFYHQLYQFTHSGLGVIPALEQLLLRPPGRSYRDPIRRALEHLRAGVTFTEAWHSVGTWLPEFDMTLIEAGERSGRLDQCFRLLADHYTERAQVAKQLITTLAYPAFLVHLLGFVMALVFFFWFSFRIAVLPLVALGFLYLLVAIMVYAAQNKHAEGWRAFVEAVIHPIPILGTARRYRALSQLSAALEALLSAGVTIIEAWESAAAVGGSPALRRAVLSWTPLLRAGKTPAEVLNSSRVFPDLFISQYMAGEMSGRLDETLRHLRDYYREEGSRKLRTVSIWVPILISLFVMGVIAVFVIWFWISYFQRALSAIE